MTRIALAHPTYWPEVRRGAERLVHDLGAGLAAREHEVTVITSRPPGRARIHAEEDGMTVLRFPRLRGGGRLSRRGWEDHLDALPFSAVWLAAGRFDVVHAFQAPEAAVAAGLPGPSVYAHMGIPHRAWLVSRRARLRLVERAVGCSAVTALSEHARDAFHTFLGVEATVIPPPVDTAFFAPGGERAPEPTIVCAADAREPRKRVPLLVEAFALVRRDRPTARLLLDARTTDVVAPGVACVDMTDLPAVYRSAWVSALPSWGEAFGLVLAEALACGTPVVGSDRDGIPEVLGGDDRVGRLFAGDDPGPLADALLETLELAQDPGTAAACRARAETFSVAACVDRHEQLYASLNA